MGASVSKPVLRILYVPHELQSWAMARTWPYGQQLALEEGFRANQIECLTLPAIVGLAHSTSPWFSMAQEICAGKRFDQVWVDALYGLDEACFEWLAGLAPVRIGMVWDCFNWDRSGYIVVPECFDFKARVERLLPYLTHLLLADERDAEEMNATGRVPAMWLPPTVPGRAIYDSPPPPIWPCALLAGSVYGERSRWLRHPSLKDRIRRLSPPEDASALPQLFDQVVGTMVSRLARGERLDQSLHEQISTAIASIRRDIFDRWLMGLQAGCAIVNPPQHGWNLSSRVVEGMAAGRPVLTWEIPDRPRQSQLFRDGQEVLLYPRDELGVLAAHIERLARDPDYGRQIAANARQRLRQFCTWEKRVQLVLDWLETGNEVDVNDEVAAPATGGQTTPAGVKSSVGLDEGWRPNAADMKLWKAIASLLDQRRRAAEEDTNSLRILEAGCGRGWLTNLANTYGSCEGIDASVPTVERALSLFPHLRFSVGTLGKLAVRSDREPYEVVIVSEPVDQNPAEQQRVVRGLRRLLKPGGWAILTPAAGVGPDQGGESAIQSRSHSRDPAKRALPQILSRAGFEPLARLPPPATGSDSPPACPVWAFAASTKRRPEASVIISARDEIEGTRRCLNALAEVSRARASEVIVVESALCPNSRRERPGLGTNVRTVRVEGGGVKARAWNQAARHARGRYLIFLDRAAVPLDGWLQPLTDELIAHPEVDIVGSKLIDPSGAVQEAGLVFCREDSLPYPAYQGFPADAPEVRRRREALAVSGVCMLVRRSTFEAMGGFDEAFEGNLAAVDLCLRVRQLGARVVYQPQSVVRYAGTEPEDLAPHGGVDGQLLLERWEGHWLGDEDTVYVADGYLAKHRWENGRAIHYLEPLVDAEERIQWERVAEAQRRLRTGDLNAVGPFLFQPDKWPVDPWALRWGVRVALRLVEPDAARGLEQRALSLLEGVAEEGTNSAEGTRGVTRRG